MQLLSLNLADAVVLSVLVCVVALIVRGMLKGVIKTCSGNCAGCGQVCQTQPLKLNESQLAQLREIDRRAQEL